MILYYYHKEGNTVGPVTLAELRDKLTAGELGEESLACPSGAQIWEPLRVVLAKAPSETPPLPPHTSSRITGAITGAVRGARDRLSNTEHVMQDENASTPRDDKTEAEATSMTLAGTWKVFGILGVVVSVLAFFVLTEYSFISRIVFLILSLLDLLVCLTLSQACKALQVYLKNNG